MKMNERQIKMLSVMVRSPTAMPIGLSELVDIDFCNLIEADFVDMTWNSLGGLACNASEAGRAALSKAEGRSDE